MGNEKCDICGKIAVYDAKTTLEGMWAYLCEDCFEIYGIKLGLGYGQLLEIEDEGEEEEYANT